jgi:hypothetical protein
MVPHCVTRNWSKSSWDYRRRRVTAVMVQVASGDTRLYARYRCAWAYRQTCRATALNVRPWYPVNNPSATGRHLNTMPGKTFIEADVPRVHCLQCGAQQIPVVWAEDGSRYPGVFEAYAIQVLQAVQSPVQAQWLTALSWGLSRPGHRP